MPWTKETRYEDRWLAGVFPIFFLPSPLTRSLACEEEIIRKVHRDKKAAKPLLTTMKGRSWLTDTTFIAAAGKLIIGSKNCASTQGARSGRPHEIKIAGFFLGLMETTFGFAPRVGWFTKRLGFTDFYN